ncbi:hypothetical protein CC117_18415 [Parafrankia colletiae]|uniref:Uncharacterized protein n=1 Tax=Parafrankia colletiae TaxID=573497 RepID=A0A1S1QN73_9ACTN|nr:hypothetical protein [Frankia sp. Cpl3]OHV36163.1 hypothetical protein CC117_18415 [Parafrankia colletiae]
MDASPRRVAAIIARRPAVVGHPPRRPFGPPGPYRARDRGWTHRASPPVPGLPHAPAAEAPDGPPSGPDLPVPQRRAPGQPRMGLPPVASAPWLPRLTCRNWWPPDPAFPVDVARLCGGMAA